MGMQFSLSMKSPKLQQCLEFTNTSRVCIHICKCSGVSECTFLYHENMHRTISLKNYNLTP